MGEVIDDLRTTARETGADEFGDGLVSMLVHDDLQTALVDDAALPTSDVDLLTGPFAHVVVDEAQELSDAEWAMLLRRCPSRSLTVVGDRAQARHGFAESWTERLARVGLTDVTVAPLTVNYRTPAEVMAEAEPVIRAALPEANVPTSVRESGIPVLHAPVAERDAIIEDWLAEHAEGTAVVVERDRSADGPATLPRPALGRSRPLAHARAGQGTRVRPRGARRPRRLRGRRGRRGGPLRRDDPRHATAGGAHDVRSVRARVARRAVMSAVPTRQHPPTRRAPAATQAATSAGSNAERPSHDRVAAFQPCPELG